ncbi:Hypothetical protein A7982_06926 [Minicystis rosea]|nr:Hypothetical protein A7982_06926 [Minicystis rosea]
MKARYFAALLAVLVPAPAWADTLNSGVSGVGTVTRLGKGLKEIGLDSMLVVGYDKTGDASALRISALSGPTFRFFVVDNLSLSLNASVLIKKTSADGAPQQFDFGGLGSLSAGYHASIGGGLFIVPTLGAGGFYGRRTTGTDPGAVRTGIYGGTGTLALMFAFYPSAHLSMRAGPQAVVSFGRSSGDAGGQGFLSTDAGFSIGLSYVF